MEKMVDKWLEVVAEKLGLGIEHFWPIIVRQQVIEGLITIAFFFVCVTIFLWLMRKVLILREKWDPNNPKWTEEETKYFICSIFAATFFILSFAVIVSIIADNAITHIINPEYHAIMDIGKTLKP